MAQIPFRCNECGIVYHGSENAVQMIVDCLNCDGKTIATEIEL